MAQQLAGRLSLVLVAGIAGPAALGAVSAARTLFTPLNSLIAAALSISLPQAVREIERSPGHLTRFTRRLSLVLVLTSVSLTLFILAMPESWGTAIAGQNWASAQKLALPTGLWIVGISLSQGARVGLRALGQGATILRTSVALGVLLLASTTIGTWLYGGQGAAWGFGVASVAGQGLWFVAYRSAVLRRDLAHGVG